MASSRSGARSVSTVHCRSRRLAGSIREPSRSTRTPRRLWGGTPGSASTAPSSGLATSRSLTPARSPARVAARPLPSASSRTASAYPRVCSRISGGDVRRGRGLGLDLGDRPVDQLAVGGGVEAAAHDPLDGGEDERRQVAADVLRGPAGRGVDVGLGAGQDALVLLLAPLVQLVTHLLAGPVGLVDEGPGLGPGLVHGLLVVGFGFLGPAPD